MGWGGRQQTLGRTQRLGRESAGKRVGLVARNESIAWGVPGRNEDE